MTKTEPIGERQPGEPRLYGAKEASAALGVSQPNLRTVAGLPAPYGKIAATTLYRASDIDSLAMTRKQLRKAAAKRARERAEAELAKSKLEQAEAAVEVAAA